MRKKRPIGCNDLRIWTTVDWRRCVLVNWRWSKDGKTYTEYLCPVSWFNEDHPAFDGTHISLGDVVEYSLAGILSAHFAYLSGGGSMAEHLCRAFGFPLPMHPVVEEMLGKFGAMWERSVEAYRFGKRDTWKIRYNPVYWERNAKRTEQNP